MQNFFGRTRCVLGNVKVADHACESRTYIQTSRTCSWMGVLPKFLLIKFKCLDWHIHVKFYLKPQSVLKWEEVRSLRCENSVLFLSKNPLIFTTKVLDRLHLASFWEGGFLEFRNGLLYYHLRCIQSCVYVAGCTLHMTALVFNGASVTALVTVFFINFHL